MECEICKKTFAAKVDLLAHTRRSHRAPDLLCSQCATYRTKLKFQLERHRKKCVGPDVQPAKRSFACPLCSLTIVGREAMINHYQDVHSVQIERKSFNFRDTAAFQAWKKEIESQGCFRFRMYDKKSQSETYRCFRDGIFKSRGTGKRRLKMKGSCKIDGVCPCSMKVVTSKDTGAVNVTYTSRHVGHAFDIGRLNLSVEERRSIAEKLSQHVPMDVILDSIRESIDGEYSRIHLTTRKDLANIKESFQVTDGRLHSDDRTSVEAWIKSTESQGIVRFYKPQSAILEDHPELTEEDFVLVISFDGQIDMLKRFGADVVCFDGTHGTNAYDFELHTLMVKDAKSQGFPCAFLITNRSDARVMALFLTVIYNLLPQPIIPEVLMTDMSEVYWNGWCSTFPKPKHWLFCQWHVERAWRKNLNKILDPYKRSTVYKLIRTVMDEPDERSFQELLKRALAFLSHDPSLSAFEQYFRTEYCINYKYQSWAFCYRKYLGINTNMMLESMHKVLKYIYLEGKKVKRLDKGINALVKFVRDKFLDQLISVERGKLTSRLTSIRDRHAKSLNLECKIVPQQDSSSWLISSSSGTDMYEVKKLLDVCGCDDKCEICLVCIHQYRCTCMDSMKSNLCKHIHRIVTVTSQIQPAGSSAELIPISVGDLVVADSESNNVEIASLLDDVIAKNRASRASCSQVNFEKAKETATQLFFSCLNSAKNMDHMDVILKQVAPIPHLLQAVDSGLKFKTPRKVNPQSKLSPQKSLYSTKKVRQKGNENSLRKPTSQEKQELSLQLLKNHT